MQHEDEDKRQEVVRFLKDFKECVLDYPGLFAIDRHINREALIELGLTEHMREVEIISLSVENYSSGP